MATQKKVTKPRATNPDAATPAAPKAVESSVKTGTQVAAMNVDAAAKTVEDAVKATQQSVQKANAETLRAFDQFYAFNKHNFDAMMAAGDVYMKGVESFNQAVMETARKNVEAGLANTKAVFGAKNLKEAVDLNNEFARKAFDDVVADATRFSEMTTKIANEAAKPLSARVTETFQTFVKTAA
jgi:phasin family protein